jgi:hypothetical protein
LAKRPHEKRIFPNREPAFSVPGFFSEDGLAFSRVLKTAIETT